MTTPGQQESPSQILARQIVERLMKERLINHADADKVRQQLAEGKLKAEDWRLLIEIGTDPETRR